MPTVLSFDTASAASEPPKAREPEALRTNPECRCALCRRLAEEASIEVRLGTGHVEISGTFSVNDRKVVIRAGRDGALTALAVFGTFSVAHGILSPVGH